MIWILNPEGIFTSINKTAEEGLGYERSEVIGKNFQELLHLTNPSRFKNAFLKALQGEPQEFEIRFRTKNRKIRTISAMAAPFHQGGKHTGVLIFGREITGSRKAEETLRASEERLRVVVDHLPQKIFLKDKNSVYRYCNGNFARDLGIRPDQIAGKSDYDLYPEGDAERQVSEDKTVIKSGKPVDVEGKHLQHGEHVIVHRFKTVTRDKAGNVTGILEISWDVTEKARLKSIADTVNVMNHLGYFLSGIRHEIGNPICTAKLALKILREKAGVFPKETVDTYLENTMLEIAKVEYLLQALKNFNIYEILKPRNVEVKSFFDKFLDLVAEDLGKKGIVIGYSVHPEAETIHVDPAALQQVLLNVISNASDALHGKENPRITMDIQKRGKTVWIHISDNGCGMFEEQLLELFKPFQTSKPNGTGLGLITARKILAEMAGTIEIKSQKNMGTTVEISILEGSTGSDGSC